MVKQNNNCKEKTIKVLYIAGRINITNGAYHSLKSNLFELMKKGVEPTVLLATHGKEEDEFKELGIRCIVIPYLSCTVPADKPNKLKAIYKSIVNYLLEFKVYHLLKIQRFDVVHINVGTVNFGAASALKLNIPLIWHLREFLEEDVNMTYFNKRKISKQLIAASQIIAISNAVAKHFEKYYGINNVLTVYNGIHIKLRKEIFNKVLFDTTKYKVFSIVGRITKEKGQFDAVKAFADVCLKIDNIELIIVGNIGDESYYRNICDFIDSRGIKEKVKFYKHQKDLTKVWEQTDIALVCSRREGFGRVTAEFMLNRIPVIGANSGATSELLMNHRGILYENGNIVDLSNQMLRALKNSEQLKEYIENAYKYAFELFTAEHCASAILDTYKKLIKNKWER